MWPIRIKDIITHIFPIVNVPSSPDNLESPNGIATTLLLTWTQPPGEVVDSFIISFSYFVRECPGDDGSATVSVNRSARSFTLTGLQEDSHFNISILARNAAGDSPPSAQILAATDIDGKPLFMTTLNLDMLFPCL